MLKTLVLYKIFRKNKQLKNQLSLQIKSYLFFWVVEWNDMYYFPFFERKFVFIFCSIFVSGNDLRKKNKQVSVLHSCTLFLQLTISLFCKKLLLRCLTGYEYTSDHNLLWIKKQIVRACYNNIRFNKLVLNFFCVEKPCQG